MAENLLEVETSNEQYIQGIVDALVAIGALQQGQAIKGKDIAALVRTLKLGMDTGDATATAKEVIDGKTFYGRGAKYVGTMPAMSGYVNISVNKDNGIVTGEIKNTNTFPKYVAGESTLSGSFLLSTKAGGTVTPTTEDMPVGFKGDFLTGNVTVKGDANLLASNIKSGVSIFNVSGTYTGSPNVYRGNATRVNSSLVTCYCPGKPALLYLYGTANYNVSNNVGTIMSVLWDSATNQIANITPYTNGAIFISPNVFSTSTILCSYSGTTVNVRCTGVDEFAGSMSYIAVY